MMRSTSGEEDRTDSSLMTLLREHSGQRAKVPRPRPASHAGRRRSSDVFVEDAAAVTVVTPSRRSQRPKSASSGRLRRAKKSSMDSGCCDDDEEDELIYVDEDYKRRSSASSFESTGIGGLSLAPTAWDDPSTNIYDVDGAKPSNKQTTLSILDAEPRRRVFSDSDVISGLPLSEHDVMGLGRLAPMIAAERVLERYRRRTSLDATGNRISVAPAHNPHKPTSRAPENGQQLPRKLRPILVRARQNSLGDDGIGRDDVMLNGTSGLGKAGLVHSQHGSAVDPPTPRGEGSPQRTNDSTSLMTRDFGRSRAWRSLQPLESRRPSNPLPQTPQ